MSETPRHDHWGVLFIVVLLLLIELGVGVHVLHPVVRADLRCSAFVAPPKGCVP